MEHCGVSCKQEAKIATLEQRDSAIIDSLSKLEGKIDLILTQVTKIAVLESNHDHQQAAIDRAFDSIRLLRQELDLDEEKRTALQDEFNAFVNKVHGMKMMAIFLWTVMGSSLGLALLKLWSH